MALLALSAACGLVLSSAPPRMAAPPRSAPPRMALVEEFAISRVVKDVRVFDGDYADEIRTAVSEVAKTCIEDKGSFSLAVPGGSVVAALGGFESDSLGVDFSKVHVFFCNEKLPSFPCIEGALKETSKIGIPEAQVYGFAKEGSPAEVAASYTALLESHESIDNTGPVPSVDMMLLGT